MFTIDLLKGHGIPIKTRPAGIAIGVTALAVPVIVTLTVISFYFSDKVIISVKKIESANYQRKIDELSDAVSRQNEFVTKKSTIDTCLLETNTAFKRHLQWSPILETLVKNMPETVILTKLKAEQRQERVKVPDKSDPSQMTEITVPAITLRISLSGSGKEDMDKEIKAFRERLRNSDALKSKLEDILVSQGVDNVEGKEIISYDIDCIFKPQV